MSNARFSFAVHIVSFTSWREQQGLDPVTSRELATSIGTSPVVVRRLLSSLSDAGLLETMRGRHGGARLARPADEVTLADVYDAVAEDDALLGGYPSGATGCDRVGRHIAAALKRAVTDAEAAFRASLARTTVADVRDDVARAAGLPSKPHAPAR